MFCCQSVIREYDGSYQAFLNEMGSTVALVDEPMDDGSISVAAEVEVAGYSINFEKAFHPASLLVIDVLDDPLKLLIIIHIFI